MLKILASLLCALLMFISFGVDDAAARAKKPKAYSKKYSVSASVYALEQCFLSNDAKYAETATRTACCSKEEGLCVICPTKGPLNCEIVTYKKRLTGFNAFRHPSAPLAKKFIAPR